MMELATSIHSGPDESRPSIFEVLAERHLSDLLRPSLRLILVHFTLQYPRYLLRILNRYEETYSLLSLVVERHFLRTYQGTLTEYFYGLKRERVPAGDIDFARTRLGAPDKLRESLKLDEVDIWKSLAVTIGIAYIRRQLDEAYQIHVHSRMLLGPRYQRDTLPPNPTLRQRIFHIYKWFLREIYPKINAIYYASLLCYGLLYLSGRSEFPDPFMRIIGQRLRRLSAADHREIAQKLASGGISTIRASEQTVATRLREGLKSQTTQALSLVLPASVFALKLLEWWHLSDFGRQIALKVGEGQELPVPPRYASIKHDQVPEMDETSGKGSNEEAARFKKQTAMYSVRSGRKILTVPLSADSSVCSICLWPINTPTACQTGYTFCYTCIFKWVDGIHPRQEELVAKLSGSSSDAVEDGHGRCPITGKQLLGGTGGLRKIIV